MASITLRSVKGSALTNAEVDSNFSNINTEVGTKANSDGTGASGTWSISISGNAATVTSGVYTTGSYANPSWITSIAWSKVSSTPTTLTGYGITDAQPLDADLTSIAGLAGTSGFLKKTAANSWSLDTSAYLTGNQSITLSGDASGTGTTAISVTLANSGVTAGTYRSVTVDVKGRVTGGTNPTTLSGYGITDAQPLDADLTAIAALAGTSGFLKKTAADSWSLDTNTYLTGNQSITLSGDASGSGATSIAVTLANSGVVAGTYTKVTVDAKGRVTTGASLASGDLPTYTGSITSTQVTTGLGYTPENPANKGVANGYASLDASAKVPAAQLPSYVDDVLEYANLAGFPATGETGKIYVALDTNKTYRWSGSAYVEISPSPGSTDAVTEGSTNLYFTNTRARNAISVSGSLGYNSGTGVISFTDAVTSVAGKTGAVTLTNSDVGLGNVENKSSATIRGELTSGNVTTALGFTPYNSTNPNGYITSSGVMIAGGSLGNPADWDAVTTPGNYTIATSPSLTGTSNPGGYPYGTLIVTADGSRVTQTYIRHDSGNTKSFRNKFNASDWQPWVTALTSSNYNSYSPTLTGTGASGTWGISITGNAATVTNGLTTSNYSSYALPLTGGTVTGRLNQLENVVKQYLWVRHIEGKNWDTYDTTASGLYLNYTSNATVYIGSSAHVALHGGNYNSYSPSLTGSGASGTWGISITGNAATASSASAVAWGNVSSKPSSIMYYQGFTLDANTMDSNATGFTYSNNAPHTGPVARFSTGGGYDLWLNAPYQGGGSISFRTRNGDTATLNAWRTILTDSNYTSYSPSLTGSGASGSWGISVTGSSASCTGNAATASSASTSGAVYSSGYGNGNFTWRQESGTFAGQTGWASYLISNHGDGATYYNQTLIMPFWGAPQYSRLEGGVFRGPYTFLTTENYTSYSPSLTGSGASGTWGISITGSSASCTGNAATAYGLNVHTGRNNEANKVVRTDGNGYIQAGWINTDSGDNGTTAIDRVYASSDGYIRYYTPANFRTVLDVPTRTGGSASGTWGISITGTAAGVSAGTGYVYRSNVDTGPAVVINSDGAFYGHIARRTTQQWGLGHGGGVGGATTFDFYYDTSGNVTAVGNVTAYSDERVKANWRGVDDGFVARLADVKSGIYDRTDIDVTQAGVSAQSLREVLPEVVLESADGDLSVAYGNAAMVAAVELAKEVVALKREIEALKSKRH